MQTEQYSGVGLSAAVAGWGCFAVVRDLVNSFMFVSFKAFVGTACYTLQILAMTTTIVRAYKRREGMQLGKHQNSNMGRRMCMNASCSRFLLIERRQKCS